MVLRASVFVAFAFMLCAANCMLQGGFRAQFSLIQGGKQNETRTRSHKLRTRSGNPRHSHLPADEPSKASKAKQSKQSKASKAKQMSCVPEIISKSKAFLQSEQPRKPNQNLEHIVNFEYHIYIYIL